MILHWDQLALHYGPELNAYRRHFELAEQTTYGLIACRFSPEDDRLSYSNGDHAEQRLMDSPVWRQDIPTALDAHGPYSSPIVTTLIINRSPCRNCAQTLCRELVDLHARFPVRADENRFILACRGVYEPRDMRQATTNSDLFSLHSAGWELCVLQVGAQLPKVGEILLDSVRNICGTGYVKLG